MNHDLTIHPIAYIRTDFKEKFGIPRQPGLVPGLEGIIEFCPEFRSADFLRGIQDFDYLWLLFGFSQNWDYSESDTKPRWSALVRPPRLGGQTKKGVFATRSPYRPNGLGMSCVRFLRVENGNSAPYLVVGGADLLDGTPIYDIKPYVAYSDSKPEAKTGFATPNREFLQVNFPMELLSRVAEKKRPALIGVLEQDPRDGYNRKPDAIYGLRFADYDVRFVVEGDILRVVDVTSCRATHVK